jgi:hypothetical protein
MADTELHFGGIIDVTDTPQVVRFLNAAWRGDQSRGKFINRGEATVYIGWNKTAVANNTAGDDKCYLVKDESVDIPRSVSYASVATASSTAKLLYTAT